MLPCMEEVHLTRSSLSRDHVIHLSPSTSQRNCCLVSVRFVDEQMNEGDGNEHGECAWGGVDNGGHESAARHA